MVYCKVLVDLLFVFKSKYYGNHVLHSVVLFQEISHF